MTTPQAYYLDLLLEERLGDLHYALPADDAAWQSARDAYANLVVQCDLDHLTPQVRLSIELAILSRDHRELAIDLAQLIRRDAPSLFTRFRGYCYQMDADGHRVGVSQQQWRHAE